MVTLSRLQQYLTKATQRGRAYSASSLRVQYTTAEKLRQVPKAATHVTSAFRKPTTGAGTQLAFFFLLTLPPHSMGWCCPHCSLYFSTMLNPM